MDGIRAKISARLEDGLIHVTLEWVAVADNAVLPGAAYPEEVRISPDRPGTAYLSRAVFADGTFLPGTFWLDEAGLRHFVMEAESGIIDMFGKDVAMKASEPS